MKQLQQNTLSLGLGVVAGLAGMYLLDPRLGRRRRSVLRDRSGRAVRRLGDTVELTARNVRDEAYGRWAELRRATHPGAVITDEQLISRIRARLGRVVSHPHAVSVESGGGGVVRLSGPVLKGEVRRLLRTVRQVQGVKRLMNELKVYADAGNIPSLQGGIPQRGPRSEFMRVNWGPAARVAAGATGLTLLSLGAIRRGWDGAAAALAGSGLLLRAVYNREVRQLLGVGRARRPIVIHRSIAVAAPREEVYSFLRKVENLPRFMAHLKEVRPLDERRSRWTVEGPAGISTSWESVITRDEPNHEIAWQSERGAEVEASGSLHINAHPRGGTLLDLNLAYTLPGGPVGRLLAGLFGGNPTRTVEDDLTRLQSLLERGTRAPRPEGGARDRGEGPTEVLTH